MKIPINIKQGSLEKEEIPSSKNELIFGIDLGTTNSLIAFVNPDSGSAETVKEDGDNSLVPSIVHFGKENLSIGSSAKKFLVTDPQHTIYSVKRLMGKSYSDVKDHEGYFGYKIIDEDSDKLVKIHIGKKFFTPIELSSFILKELKDNAEKALDTTVRRVVITVPAYFNDSQRQATRDAGKLAGLEVLRIINEPTAAALAYGIGLDPKEVKTIAVYDLGGGTFDISILRIHEGVFEVLSTNGDTFLGGDDFDRAVVDFWLKKNNRSPDELKKDKSLSQSLRLKAEEAKIHLSDHDSFDEIHEEMNCHITRKEFDSLSKFLIAKTMDCVKRALKDAKMQHGGIDVVVMVGGATRIPAVKNLVSKFFKKPVYDKLNPDEVVALGAAIEADVLAGNRKDILLVDVTPLSLGIETIGELMDVIIPRNSKIPTKASRQYTTSVDGQANLRIAVYQGERDLVRDNRKLAEFILTNIPSMPAGLPKVEISFVLNADGILSVRAKELRSEVEQTIEVKPQYGLTDAEVEQMLFDSIAHANEDMKVRALLEARTEASLVLQAGEKFLKTNTALLFDSEVTGIRSHMKALADVLNGDDKDLIHLRLDELNEFTNPFAERVMNAAINKAMKGKKV